MKANYLKNVENILGYLLAFSIFFPILTLQAILKPVKIPFIGLAIILAVILILSKKKIGLHKATLILAACYLIRGIYGTISGILQSAPGVFVVIDLSITYVLIHYIFLTLIVELKTFDWLITIFYISTFFIVFLDTYYILYFLDVVPYLPIYDLFQSSPTPFKIGINQYKTVELYARNLGVLVFAFPFFVSLLFQKNISARLVNFWTVTVLTISLTLLMLLTGRRILILIMLITPFMIFGFSRFLSYDKRSIVNKGMLSLLIITTLGVFSVFTFTATKFNLELGSLVNSFYAAFDSNQESIRFDQGNALIQSWLKSPFLGHGIGAGVDGFFRDANRPWAFELGFHVSLHRLGLLGFLFELIYYLGIIYLGILEIKKDNDFIMIGLLCGFICFLIAHATNPFLNSYEYLWPLILPLIYINTKLLKK